MATTTPNFGWPVPTSTDLVKDGATAIEGLGDAIDASLLDLKGGTTGQVLAKASNTDMDFVWSADAAGISPTIVNAKGDIIGASANDTPAITSVGADGSTLVANSAAATGLSWAGQPYANPVINSAFQVWQRGTSAAFGSGGVVTSADRWATYTGGAATLSRQVTGDTTNLPFIQYCARMQRNSGSAATNDLTMANSFETINSIPYAGKTVTLSFYARAGANYSPTSNGFQAYVRTGTGTDQNYTLTGYTGSSGFTSTSTLTTTWQRFTLTGTIAATATEMAVEFRFSPTGTAGANDYAEVTGVQIDFGSVALPFKTNGTTLQGELAACQRYYQRFSTNGANNVAPVASGFGTTTTTAGFVLKLTTTMRTAPTSLDASGMAVYSATSVFTPVGTLVIGTNQAGTDTCGLVYTHGSAALTVNAPYYLGFYGTNYVGVSAEL